MKIHYLLASLAALSMCSSPPPGKHPSPTVSVAVAQERDVLIHLDYVGHVEPYTTVQVQSQIQGVITGKYYQDGQEVKQGDTLFTIDSRPYVAALQKAEAILEQNLASLAYTKERVKRYSVLVDEEYVSLLNYDQFVKDTLVDEATIKQNEADIEEAKIELDYCTITAPMDSITGFTTVDVGNLVNVGQSTPLVTLNQIEPILISFYVPEKDLPQIQRLQREAPLTVQVFLNGERASFQEGQLTLIDNQVDESTGRILLQATLSNKDHILWPGEYVEVHLILSKKEHAVVVPTQAVQIGQQGPYAFVVKENNTIELRPVIQGQKEGETVIIEKGVAANEKVVTEGQLNLRPGIQVTIKASTE